MGCNFSYPPVAQSAVVKTGVMTIITTIIDDLYIRRLVTEQIAMLSKSF